MKGKRTYRRRYVVYDKQHHNISFIIIRIVRAVLMVPLEVSAPFAVEFLLGEHLIRATIDRWKYRSTGLGLTVKRSKKKKKKVMNVEVDLNYTP